MRREAAPSAAERREGAREDGLNGRTEVHPGQPPGCGRVRAGPAGGRIVRTRWSGLAASEYARDYRPSSGLGALGGEARRWRQRRRGGCPVRC